ncbi:MAG: GNAT family N-acetyltransferase [Ferruginibacter sp.]
MISYYLATSNEEYEAAKQLFTEYATSINIDLDFQQFDKELQTLMTMYGPPSGGIILAKQDEHFIGCVGIRKINETVGEMKRMYLKPEHQNKGLGKILLGKAFDLARACNYNKIRLDTLNEMVSAIALYKKAGFYEIEPYYFNPIPTAVYFEREL